MKKTFVKKAILSTAAMTSAALLTFGPDAASAKTLADNTSVHVQHQTITNEDLNTFIDILNQCIYEQDGVYYFDSEKAVELGMTKEEAQVIATLWESTSEFFSVVSQCVYVEDGNYKFDTEKAVELGFTEKEALALEQFFSAASLKIHILQAAIVLQDGVYSYDKDAAVQAGATPLQADVYEKLFSTLSQEQLAAIYEMVHPQV
ncbi:MULTISPECIES: hypothetical protein [unclassified Bacillus (in: firmicutes)]|uniref:hypothetical protein n=1 Tax=unclassified Bacillus (in: firmicutes) TaxID=185979 RepID=UPI0022814069|nr:hypothetical protein [Bacillus sp. S20C3]MCY8202601.1 hypothetical protein [Bacillus sp. N12A5]MCY8290529.1 hypothetical protein [Bacillus sp. N13C7]MCY8639675.1 hypothetical protein [Bacillus sp. S17B2]MCY8719879.1 hypothetical protein [Bacillus sp. S10C12M]MCY9145785.1 hypothetical protein [Bacillus sp. T9C1]